MLRNTSALERTLEDAYEQARATARSATPEQARALFAAGFASQAPLPVPRMKDFLRAAAADGAAASALANARVGEHMDQMCQLLSDEQEEDVREALYHFLMARMLSMVASDRGAM